MAAALRTVNVWVLCYYTCSSKSSARIGTIPDVPGAWFESKRLLLFNVPLSNQPLIIKITSRCIINQNQSYFNDIFLIRDQISQWYWDNTQDKMNSNSLTIFVTSRQTRKTKRIQASFHLLMIMIDKLIVPFYDAIQLLLLDLL